MKYAYTDQPVEGFHHRNPRYWSIGTPPKDATEVVVGKGYSEIAEYFEDAGVMVRIDGGEIEENDPEQITPESVAKMNGGDLTELLEAHGVEEVPHKLDERRDMLTKIMFTNL